MANRILGYIANLTAMYPIICDIQEISYRPSQVSSSKVCSLRSDCNSFCNLRFQGDDMLDPDLPTYFEAWLFQSRIGKVFYIARSATTLRCFDRYYVSRNL